MARPRKKQIKLSQQKLAVIKKTINYGFHDASFYKLPDFYSDFSRQDFSLPQLWAILRIRDYFHFDFRTIQKILTDHEELRELLEINKSPHYATLARAEKRLKLMMNKLSTAKWKKLDSNKGLQQKP